MARTVVGLFNSAPEAQQAIDQLLAAGFIRSNLNLATQATLRAEHLAGNTASSAPVEPFEEGIVRFFTNLFTGNENAAAEAHIAASGPDSAVITVNPGSDDESERARIILDEYGAIDVYKQAEKARPATSRPSLADNIVDLEGSLSRVRDKDDLDANGLTTH
ncbi:hypothetical protein I2I05_08055 [Hymenobacter sp. BT683]|uniref:General stress protein 17M-like domain-containing protein n=1 Tax=Hymenobacter jeongseonensis TaxID=2791027 RepID=A0ABS0IH28_9BACT|nr:hypothetical protein [Hymenobacter jeongseonensis]MBF9237349.1 hypothetical protein [Hymenobacter jeongseonensis]